MATTDCRNIGDVDEEDIYYRYKMPRMVTKVEGKGNGVRTNIVNMVDIAKALRRPASYMVKYFGYALGAQTRNSIVNGEHKTTTLDALLDELSRNVDMRDKFTRFVVNHPPTKEAATEAAVKEGEPKEQKKRGKKVGKKKASSSSS
ncbi:hypothetical protein Tsubulata_023947 [Turnera subulata]|uniref:Translation initiation factor IF2/IF5 domain-containing protein n=1 Tax=Turnera subulata TaxID=218843 RepID=A0A9Q0F7T1_9ROSI|nr:hypothetical protein Tsubulata_023947 [Turnera subulata]